MALTLISMFYDLGKIENNPYRRQASEYLNFGTMVLSLNYPLIFFTSKEFANIIREKRKSLGFEHQTIVISMEFDELPYFKYLEEITMYWNDNMKCFPNKLTPHYSTLMWCKTYMVRKAVENNVFQTKHFGWIDFGMNYFLKDRYDKDKPLFGYSIPDKIRMMSINYFNKKNFEDYRYYYHDVPDYIVGTVFTGSGENFIQLDSLFQKEVLKSIQLKCCPVDEPLFPIIMCDNPDLFDLYYGHFASILLNYEIPRGSFDKILDALFKARVNGDYKRAFHIGSYIEKNYLILPPKQIALWLDEYFIAAFYIDKEKLDGLLNYSYINFN